MSEQVSKTCFIITPIGPDNSDVRRAAEGVIDAVVIPVLEKEGFNDIKVAHRMPSPGSITKQIINRIISDDLVIANLSGLNPNVMYELAIRHAARKPVIQICENTTTLPFDVVEERTIIYKNDMAGVVEIKDKFSDMVKAALSDEQPDNPIYRAIEKKMILQNETISDLDKYLIQRLDSMEEKINNISQINSSQTIRNKIKKLYEVRYKRLDECGDLLRVLGEHSKYLPSTVRYAGGWLMDSNEENQTYVQQFKLELDEPTDNISVLTFLKNIGKDKFDILEFKPIQ